MSNLWFFAILNILLGVALTILVQLANPRVRYHKDQWHHRFVSIEGRLIHMAAELDNLKAAAISIIGKLNAVKAALDAALASGATSVPAADVQAVADQLTAADQAVPSP